LVLTLILFGLLADGVMVADGVGIEARVNHNGQ
jgi:hypothetical protein